MVYFWTLEFQDLFVEVVLFKLECCGVCRLCSTFTRHCVAESDVGCGYMFSMFYPTGQLPWSTHVDLRTSIVHVSHQVVCILIQASLNVAATRSMSNAGWLLLSEDKSPPPCRKGKGTKRVVLQTCPGHNHVPFTSH